MIDILRSIWATHEHGLAAIALVVCLFGSYTMFSIAEHSSKVGETRRLLWIVPGGVAGGLTIWATHFVAMLSYRTDMPVRYDLTGTVSSVLTAVMGVTLAILISRTLAIRGMSIVSGILLGLSIATMHFVGMAAMHVPAVMGWDPVIAGWSIAAGTLLAMISSLAYKKKLPYRRLASPAIFSLGVAVIHFGSMAAMRMGPMVPGMRMERTDHSVLAVGITLAVLLVVAIALASERIAVARARRDLNEAVRMRSLADVSLEGIVAIDVHGTITDTNRRMREMCGRDIVGMAVRDLLPNVGDLIATDGSATDPIETRMSLEGAEAVPVEVFLHKSTHLKGQAWTVVVRDLTERTEAESRIRHVATHDALTGLPNRTLFMDRLEQSIARTGRTEGRVAMLYIDLDGFKSVNDVYGHAKGDEVLVTVAAVLSAAIRSGDTLARLGGDEFGVIQNDVAQPDGARVLAQRLIEAISGVYGEGRGDVSIGLSVGIAIAPDDATSPPILVRHADIALYQAKEAGRGTWRFFENEMDEALRARHAIENDLRRALEDGEITLAYQPQMNAADGEITGFEALVRWTHPERGMIPPLEFVPVAEQSGFIVQLGTWVLREACREAATWDIPLNVAVNLSPVQIQQGGLVRRVQDVLEETGLDPRRLELEITETALMKDREATIVTLERLKAIGIRIAMDDFGTGYSSLSNLQSFPFDKIKIDRSFVSSIEDNDKASSIVKAIIGLGHSLALPIVAEGVENSDQLDLLRDERCTEIQGYLVGRPLPISAFRHLTDTRKDESAAA